MQLVPARPTTIHAVRHAQCWFPMVYRHTDGSLLMYIEFGYDADFSPVGKWRSFDDGRTWREEEENVPRNCAVHSFADGSLYELDGYGFLDPAAADTFCFYGAWSSPDAVGTVGHSAFYHGANDRGEDWLGREAGGVLRDIVRFVAPSVGARSLTSVQHGYPHHPWWPLINRLHSPDVNSDDVLMGINITDVRGVDDVLLAVGYAPHRDAADSRCSVFCFASRDAGHTWREIGTVARDTGATAEGFNETALTVLNDGRLHAVIRSGDALYQSWSDDGGRTWTAPSVLRLVDSASQPRMVWPRVAKLEDGTLVLAYGRPGKHLVFDPSGTGENWQGHLDLHAWELETQALLGVPENQRLRGDTEVCTRYWDSGDYLSVTPCGPRAMLVTYDVQNYIEKQNAVPIAGVRMVRVELK